MELIALTILTGVVLRLVLPATVVLALGAWFSRRRSRAHRTER